MFETILDICPDGYDIDQTNFYLNSLHNRIELLEKQNEALYNSAASIKTLEDKIDLILKHLNIDFSEHISEIEETQITETETNENDSSEIPEEDTSSLMVEESENNKLDLSFIRNEIDSLKSFLKE